MINQTLLIGSRDVSQRTLVLMVGTYTKLTYNFLNLNDFILQFTIPNIALEFWYSSENNFFRSDPCPLARNLNLIRDHICQPLVRIKLYNEDITRK